MSDQINGFTKIEFLVILISIAYGYCIVDILTNWARIIRKGIIYWETLLWSIILFLGICVLWYNSWDNIYFIELSSGYFIGTLIPPIGIFIMVSALFPDQDSAWNLEGAFLKSRKLFFLMYALVNAGVLILSNVVANPIPLINYMRIIWLFACFAMYFFDSKILRSIMAVGLLCWYIYLIGFSGI